MKQGTHDRPVPGFRLPPLRLGHQRGIQRRSGGLGRRVSVGRVRARELTQEDVLLTVHRDKEDRLSKGQRASDDRCTVKRVGSTKGESSTVDPLRPNRGSATLAVSIGNTHDDDWEDRTGRDTCWTLYVDREALCGSSGVSLWSNPVDRRDLRPQSRSLGRRREEPS